MAASIRSKKVDQRNQIVQHIAGFCSARLQRGHAKVIGLTAMNSGTFLFIS
jgi:hypothetical protein